MPTLALREVTRVHSPFPITPGHSGPFSFPDNPRLFGASLLRPAPCAVRAQSRDSRIPRRLLLPLLFSFTRPPFSLLWTSSRVGVATEACPILTRGTASPGEARGTAFSLRGCRPSLPRGGRLPPRSRWGRLGTGLVPAFFGVQLLWVDSPTTEEHWLLPLLLLLQPRSIGPRLPPPSSAPRPTCLLFFFFQLLQHPSLG